MIVFSPATATKDKDSVLDYVFDAETWLNGDTISSASVTVPTGLTLDSESNTTLTVTAWLSGGTKGERYKVVCQVVTAGGRTDEGTVVFTAR